MSPLRHPDDLPAEFFESDPVPTEIPESPECDDCDGAPDGGHTNEPPCKYAEPKNVACSKCGRADAPLHVDGQCGNCGPKDSAD